MARYAVDFSYKIEEFGVVEMDADNIEQAEDFAREYVQETYPDVLDVQIDSIKELKN